MVSAKFSSCRFQIRLWTLIVFQASHQFQRDEHLLTCIWGSHGCRPRRHPRLFVSFLWVYATFFFLWEPLTNVTWVQHVGRVCGSSSFVYSSRVLRSTIHLINQYSQIWTEMPTKGHFMDKLPLIFLYYLSNRRLWRCCEWRKNSEKSWSNLYQGKSDRWIQRGVMTVKLLLFEISIWRNCLSIGCLKWLQLHNWFRPTDPFLERPDNFSGPESCFM